MKAEAERKARLRLLKFLKAGPASVRPAAGGSRQLLLDGDERGTVSAPLQVLSKMLAEGVLSRQGATLSLAGNGADMATAGADRPQRGGKLCVEAIDLGSGPSDCLVNHAESPLSQLARLKARDGRPFLSRVEFEAGERLRTDYTRGLIMPRMGANWEASVSSGRRAGGIADLTDAALAARRRVDAAIAAVGPELSGVLIDVCCFLKGMELVETERGWPVRSAKVVLKTALGVLARHYAPPARYGSGRSMLHWGADDYRPSLAAEASSQAGLRPRPPARPA